MVMMVRLQCQCTKRQHQLLLLLDLRLTELAELAALLIQQMLRLQCNAASSFTKQPLQCQCTKQQQHHHQQQQQHLETQQPLLTQQMLRLAVSAASTKHTLWAFLPWIPQAWQHSPSHQHQRRQQQRQQQQRQQQMIMGWWMVWSPLVAV
jgi:hypothetical protein